MDSEGITVVYGDVCVRKQRRKRQKLLAAEQLQDFAKNTTLHGLRYVTDRNLSIVEKIFWLITFIASVAMCFYLIRDVWIKWKTSPVIVTVSEQLVPVGVVPFPSVTICPQTKTILGAYNYTAEKYIFEKNKDNDTDNESSIAHEQKFEDVALLCEDTKYLFGGLSSKSSHPLRFYSNASVVHHILEVSPGLKDVIMGCNWRSQRVDCKKLFSTVLTREGVCFNMNSLAAEELFHKDNIHKDYDYINSAESSKGWSISGGYENDESDPYPRRGRENGAMPDLMVSLWELSKNKDKLCNGFNTGYKVYIHHPTDFPQSSLYYYGITPNHVSSLALSYSILSTSEKLKSNEYTAEIRQCYFPTERHLRYFRIYTANNCRLECITNYTFEQCGCVGFYMPHDNSSRICTYRSLGCMVEAQEQIAQEELKSAAESKACNCLPACDSIDYDAEIFKTEFKMSGYLKSWYSTFLPDEDIDFNGIKFSRLDVYFKKPRYVSMRRSELFGITDFLANCGGLLSLLLGFSFLSLVEIIYFITLRLWCTLKRDLDEEKRARIKDNK